MSRSPSGHAACELLTIEQLEAGLQFLGREDVDGRSFLDQNIVAFRHTVVFALSETARALDRRGVSPRWRIELENQMAELRQCVEVADRYLAVQARNSTLN